MQNRAEFEQEYVKLSTGCALCDLGALQPGLIELTGDDHLDWLQGQVSNDLRGLDVGESIDFCLLKPTGQIVAPGRIWRLEARSLVETPLACVSAVLERAEAMVVMEDVAARDLTSSYRLLSFQGPQTFGTIGGDFASDWIVLGSDHTGFGGLDIWVPKEVEFTVLEWFDNKASAQVVDAARLEAGIPNYGVDMSDRTLPPEMGPAFEKCNVSYTKGCYVGQEVLARIHSRGHTNKTWMALVCEDEVQTGCSLKDGAGRVTSAAWSPRFGWIAGAMLKNDVAKPGGTVAVEVPGGPVRAEVQHFPLH
ncbi:MAG: hypothetical protein HZC36_13565 [Armatimonadetes bacterium]|nr:hypothetical protein [Armatimonadota bacterium]